MCMGPIRYLRLQQNARQTRRIFGEVAGLPIVRRFLEQRVYGRPVTIRQVRRDAGALHLGFGYIQDLIQQARNGKRSMWNRRHRSSWWG